MNMMSPCLFTSRTAIFRIIRLRYLILLCSGPDEQQVQRAKSLTEDLLEVVRGEHEKVKAMLAQQQMELHQAQVQYAAYNAYGVCMLRSCLYHSVPACHGRQVAFALSWSVC